MLAGLLVGAIGAGAAMLFDAGSFAVSVACLARLRPLVAAAAAEETPPPFVEAIRAGWRIIRARSWLVAGLAAGCVHSGVVLPAVFVLLAEALGAHATLLAMSGLGVAGALAFLAVPSVRGLPRGG